MASLERKASNNSLFDFFEDGKSKHNNDITNHQAKELQSQDDKDGLRIKEISLSPIDYNTPVDVDVMCISTTPRTRSEHELEERHGVVSANVSRTAVSESKNNTRVSDSESGSRAESGSTARISESGSRPVSRNTSTCSAYSGRTLSNYSDDFSSCRSTPRNEKDNKTKKFDDDNDDDGDINTEELIKEEAEQCTNENFTDSANRMQNQVNRQVPPKGETDKNIQEYQSDHGQQSQIKQKVQTPKCEKVTYKHDLQATDSQITDNKTKNPKSMQSMRKSESRQSRQNLKGEQSRNNSDSRQRKHSPESRKSVHNSENRQSRHNSESRQSRQNSESKQSRQNSESRQSRNKETKEEATIPKIVTPIVMTDEHMNAEGEKSIFVKISTTPRNMKEERSRIESKQQREVPDIKDIQRNEQHQHDQSNKQSPENKCNIIAREALGHGENTQPGPCKNKDKNNKSQTKPNTNFQRKTNIIKKPLNTGIRKSNIDKASSRKGVSLKSNTTMSKTPSVNNNSKAKRVNRYKPTSTETSGNDSVSETVVNVLQLESNPSYSDEFKSNSDQMPTGSSTSGHSFNSRYSSSLQNSPYNSRFTSKSSRRNLKGLSLPYIHNTAPGQIVRGSTHTLKGSSDSDISYRRNKARQRVLKNPKLTAQKMGDCKKPRVPIQLKADATLRDGQLEISVTDKQDVELGTDNLNVKITLVHQYVHQKPKFQPKLPQKLNCQRQNLTNKEVVKQRAMWPAFNTHTNKEASDRYYRCFGD